MSPRAPGTGGVMRDLTSDVDGSRQAADGDPITPKSSLNPCTWRGIKSAWVSRSQARKVRGLGSESLMSIRRRQCWELYLGAESLQNLRQSEARMSLSSPPQDYRLCRNKCLQKTLEKSGTVGWRIATSARKKMRNGGRAARLHS